jgi:hypothetical protein
LMSSTAASMLSEPASRTDGKTFAKQ